jgi:hypothetical protein
MTAKTIRCEQGHFYDPEKHSSCPHCGIPNLDVGVTVPGPGVRQGAPRKEPTADDAATRGRVAVDTPATQGRGKPEKGKGRMDTPTVAIWSHGKGVEEEGQRFNPVVGWLVCTEGQDKGRDYRIFSNRNFIGRDPDMHICIAGDDTVSRQRHAIISYDPLNNLFHLLPGESSALVYYQGKPVYTPTELKPHDLIQLGRTKLLFVPLCGQQFHWEV